METKQVDELAAAVRSAEAAHAALLKTGNLLEILQAYRAGLVAGLRLAVNSGEDESPFLYEIEDTDRAIEAAQ